MCVYKICQGSIDSINMANSILLYILFLTWFTSLGLNWMLVIQLVLARRALCLVGSDTLNIKPSSKINVFDALYINDVSPEILSPSSRGTRDWRRKLQSAHLKISSNDIKHNHPLCTLPELPLPQEMQLTGRVMSEDTVLARSGS